MLDARAVTVRYGARVAVDAVDLVARPSEVLAVLGANGSGKSSLLRALAGVQHHAGTVTWDDQGAAGNPGTASGGAAGSIGYMPQDSTIRAALTAFEVVLLGRLRSLRLRVGAPDLTAAQGALDELGIAGLASRRVGELSGGQRQLVFLAQVLAANPRVLLLDEPTSALDIAHQLHVLGLLRAATARRGLTTIVVLHDLNAAARFADQVALMQAGRIVACGCPANVLSVPMLREVYGVDVSMLTAPDGFPVVVPMRAVRKAARPRFTG